MKSLTQEQIKYIIDIAKKSYEIALLERQQNGDSFAVDKFGLIESCREISSLVHYIVKDKYGISDENNKVFHCIFTFDEGKGVHQYSHFINNVNGIFIDASIEQFNSYGTNITFSPYNSNKEYYIDLNEEEPLNEVVIREEIEAYGTLDYGLERIKSMNQQNNCKKERVKMPKIIESILRIFKVQRNK